MTIKTGKIRKIDHLIEKARNRIHRVGIELEGGWSQLPPGTNLTHDGSVRFEQTIERFIDPLGRLHVRTVAGSTPAHIGELPSPPKLLNEWKEWVKQFYPQFTNDTCGLHIHMSFQSALNYSRLMTPDYQETILHYLAEWARKEKIPVSHPFWPRVMGKNRYCRREFMAQEQAERREKSHNQSGTGHRYTAINYPYGQLQTVECRVLPMFEDVNQAIGALETVIKTTNAFLISDVKREERIKVSIEGEEDSFREESITCV